MAKYNEKGQEIPDPTPVSIPLGYGHPESLESIIARMVGVQISKQAAAKGYETFEEADDFDVQDQDIDPLSVHEMTSMEEEVPRDRFGKANVKKQAPPSVGSTADERTRDRRSGSGSRPPGPQGPQRDNRRVDRRAQTIFGAEARTPSDVASGVKADISKY